jgi:hypothetical protein
MALIGLGPLLTEASWEPDNSISVISHDGTASALQVALGSGAYSGMPC